MTGHILGPDGRTPARAHLASQVRNSYSGPYLPDGPSSNFSTYDAVNPNTNRASRPFYATDSRVTLNSWSRTRALAIARWAYINVPYVRGAVDLMMGLSVGTGFAPHSLAADKGLAKELDAMVAEDFATIGFTHGESMDELLQHDSRCIDVDGDGGAIMTEDEQGAPKLQTIEGHRIRTGDVTDPNCIDGVWFDNYARRTAYNVLLPGEEETRRIPVTAFIYLAERNRPDEPRSITNLIHALNPLQDLYEIIAFEMQSVKKNSEIGLTVETPTPDRPPLGPPVNVFASVEQPAVGDQPAQPARSYTREMVYGGGGKIPILTPGEKLQAHDHTRPGSALEDWAEFIIRGIGVGMGLPFEILWNPEAIGGANTRLITALLRARLARRRQFNIFPKLSRVRSWCIARRIEQGRFRYTGDFDQLGLVEWQAKFIDITVDAGRESRERRSNVQAGLDTYTGYFAENGSSYEQQLAIREAELMAQCEVAQKLCQKYPGLPFPSALARVATLSASASEAMVHPESLTPASP